MDGLRSRLAAVERKADGGGLPTFYSEEHLAAFLAHLGRPSDPEAVAAVEELERGGALREAWVTEHRWPAAFWSADDWRL
jgi:hypothetical protein